MFIFTLKRFPHWTSIKHGCKKYYKNPLLNLKTPEVLPKYHDNIIFKNYTGNEILFNLKHLPDLRPSEISSALIELTYRQGLPADYNWNTNERIQEVVNFARTRIPQYPSRVLTTLAYAYHKMGIVDPGSWEALGKNIVKHGNKIESRGLAYAWGAFIGKGQKEGFYEPTLKYLPNHLANLNGRDLLFIVRAIGKEGIEVGDLFERLFYRILLEKKKMCSPEQLQEYLELLRERKDFTTERENLMVEALEYKKARREFRINGAVKASSLI